MLTTYYSQNGALINAQEGDLRSFSWIDLYNPSGEEVTRVEEEVQIDIPTRDEMREVESSSALYHDAGATYVTIRVVERGQDGEPGITSITLMILRDQFLTLRYAEPKSFVQFISRMQKPDGPIGSPESELLCFLETVVDRNADILEEVGDTLDPISSEIFIQDASASMDQIAAADLSRMLRRIGRAGELASRVRQSLHSVGRSLPFLQAQLEAKGELRVRFKTLGQDVQSLLEHDNFLQTQIQFLLDSNIGLISIQQNAIMKTISVAAVIFLPPTLIGSIFGMNFTNMPETHWRFGYPYAIGLMLLSAALPLFYFRRRGWL